MNGRRNRRRVLAIAAVVGLGTLGLVGRAVLPVGSTSDHPGIEEHDDPDMPRFIEGRVDETQYLKARMAHEALLLGSGEVPPQARADAVQEQHAEQAEQARQAQQQPSAEGSAPSDSVAPATTPWTAVGPSPIPNGQIVGSGPVSGRVSAIAIDPTNPSIVYLGAAQGGVFRTLDAGAHWTPIFDSAQTSAIGAITIAPSDHTKVYIGTGESSGSADSYGGVGLYRVDNATTTANLVGPINPTGASQIATGAFTGRGISQILVHPTDPATVFVTTTTGNQGLGGDNTFGGTLPPLSPKGLFRSTNATASLASISFTKLLVTGEGSVDPDTTGNDGIYDMTFAPGDPTTIIAGVNGATAGGLYRLTNVLATDPTTVTSTRTLTVNNTFRFSFSAVSPGGVSTIYAGTPESSGTLRRSNDNGVSWSSPIAGATGFCGGQCFYDLVVAADPTNANIIYVGGSANTNGAAILKKSTDGATFSDASTGLHADTHAIQIAPSPNNATVYTGNDGGVWKSTNSGLAWSDLNSTDLNTTQFQSISVHPTDPKFTIGGTQDNGTQYQNPTGTWTRADFGDGGFSAIDQGAADTTNVTMYHTYFNQKNNLIGFGRVTTVANATDNGWQFFGCGSGTANGINCGDDVQFYAPLVLGPGTPNTVYFGTNKLYRSTNQGLTMNAVSQVFQAGVAVSAIAVSPLNDSVRVVGLKNGKVFATGTGANPMTDVSAGLPTGHYVARIALDPHNVNTAYVALGGYFGGSSSHVWKTTNLTSGSPTWTNASTGIPDVPVNGLVVDPSDSKRVYAGTDIGAYFSSDSGATWAPLGTGLPVVAIFDMAVAKPATGSQVLRIATHGRGIWELPLPTTPGVYESPSPVTPGLSINVSWAGIGTPTSQDWIGVFANPGTADTGTRVAWRFTNGAATGSLPIKIPTGTPAGTTYELRLFSNNAFTKLATSAPFTVAAPTLSATPSPVNPGLSLTATWSGISSPTSQDWIAVFANSSTADTGTRVAWRFTNGAASGSLPLTIPIGTAPGTTYELRLFSNNNFTKLGTSTPFTVAKPSLSGSPPSVNPGLSLTATWSGISSPTSQDWIAVFANSGTADTGTRVAWRFTNGAASGSLPITVPVSASPGTTYELRLFSNNNFIKLATSTPLTVAKPSLTESPSPVSRGTALTATWSGTSSPTSQDWIAVFANSGTADTGTRVAWRFTNGAASGSLPITVPASASPGTTYELRLFSNNNFIKLATSVPFTVQ